MANNANNVNNSAPKQWSLTESESLTSFEAWRSNFVYRLNSERRFSVFLTNGVAWTKKSRVAGDVRGLLPDLLADNAADPNGFTAAQKVLNLELMLDQIANFCPVISRRTIVNDSTSLLSVWQAIKLHFGFQTTGGNFIDFVDIKFAPPERPETLYQRMLAFVENNLLIPGTTMTHKGDPIVEYEDMSPTLENLVVLLWLQQIHPNLPSVVKQKYGADLRSKTLASLKPEISLAIQSLMDEAKSFDARVMRLGQSGSAFPRRSQSRNFQPAGPRRFQQNSRPRSQFNKRERQPTQKLCPLCKAAGRDASHFLSMCQHLPEADKRFMTRARQVIVDDDCDDEDEIFAESEHDDVRNAYQEEEPITSHNRRVNVRSSPLFHTFYEHSPLAVTIDTGAETNLIKSSTAKAIGCPVYPSSQIAFQADGKTPLTVKGETHVILTRNDLELNFSGLIIDDLDVDILAGVPFMEENDIAVRPKSKEISIGNNCCFTYDGNIPKCPVNRHSSILRATVKTTIWPGEFLDLTIPRKEASLHDTLVAIEPHASSSNVEWPAPGIYQSVGDRIRIVNSTDTPHVFKKHAHIALASPAFDPSERQVTTTLPNDPTVQRTSARIPDRAHSDDVVLNPDGIIDSVTSDRFTTLHRRFDSVFDPCYGTYNHRFGRFEAVVNMGAVKPQQRKGRVPQYSRDKLVELQDKFDEMDALGVLVKPESIGVTVEYLNPSFLVKKGNLENEFRFVTAFTEVGKYCKPQPSLMPNVDSTLRSIARWKYIIKSDLTSAFFQIPLSKDSMKFCGVVSPFKGVRCYTRCAMGMPGSETALEELMCRVLGDLVVSGGVAKIADDLYCGGETVDELLSVWESVLHRLCEANLKLRAIKTVVIPAKTAILGWIWENGYLRADPHKVSTLSICTRPKTTKGLRSFIGAYKVLARVLPNCATLLRPLDRATHGKKSADKIVWDETTIESFEKAQKHLANNKAIVLPKESDQLWLITDGASSTRGLGATLYALRDGKLLLAGFFSQQLSPSYVKWFPCEIEGITIACAVKFFDGFIVQSKNRTQVLTDSKPCVDAYNKLLRGQFSSNARLSTYLSAACRHHIVIRHISGAVNLPSDFASRNPVICDEVNCQMCIFATSLEESVVRGVSVRDILDGRGQLPFTSRKAWHSTQSECRDLRRTRAHLLQGTRPTKKETKIKSVKRYLNKVSLATDGLLVVPQCDPLAPSREGIVVPEEVLPGLLSALHLRLNHPSQSELTKVVKRYFWAINLDSALETASKSCHLCASLSKIPSSLIPESTSDPPESVGTNFAADVMRRERQKILVVREYVSAFTWSAILPSEKGDDVRSALIMMIKDIVPLEGPYVVVRADNAPGFATLVEDQYLKDHRIHIDLGRVKNANKNPVAEKAIQELEHEILRVIKSPGPLAPLMLHEATASLNSRIRTDGLSAREIILQRDQFTNTQMPMSDRSIIASKHNRSLYNHKHSEKSKAGNSSIHPEPNIRVGDLVYVYTDRDKNIPRSRYLVTMIDDEWCYIKKFVGNTLRANSYKVKRYEIFKVPSEMSSSPVSVPPHSDEENEDEDQYDSLERPVTPAVNPLEARGSSDVVGEESNIDPVSEVPDATRPGPSVELTPDLSLPSHVVRFEDRLPAPVQPTRSSSRMRHPPSHLAAYECPTIEEPGILPSVPVEIDAPLMSFNPASNTPESRSVPVETSTLALPPATSAPDSPVKRRSSRIRRPPPHLNDYVP